MKKDFECYMYAGVGAWVNETVCVRCDKEGCPAYPYEMHQTIELMMGTLFEIETVDSLQKERIFLESNCEGCSLGYCADCWQHYQLKRIDRRLFEMREAHQ
jgi:hypothetical protein